MEINVECSLNPSVSKSNQVYVAIFQFSLLPNLRYIFHSFSWAFLKLYRFICN